MLNTNAATKQYSTTYITVRIYLIAPTPINPEFLHDFWVKTD